mmetsp:Transcript_34520/g.91835  ORF Transcript_34520/g.91835 Transcript_34520/m.91835 type:complete len:227 (-) Transcript_34520:64-744(-)
MDLHSAYPHHLEVRKYLGNFSQHLNEPNYTITRSHDDPNDPGRPMPREKTAADHFGPGQYAVDRDFPGPSRVDEHPVGFSTRSASSKKFVMPKEDRSEAMTRSWPGLGNPGPGDYHEGCGAPPGTRSQEWRQASYSVPQYLNVGGRPLPRSITGADHLGPGTYSVKDRSAEAGWRKSKAIEKLAKKNKDHWASSQYSHIFNTIKPKPRASSTPALHGASAAAPTKK